MVKLEFVPLSPEADEITRKIQKGIIYSQLNDKFLCACLGPAKTENNFHYRENCFKLLEKEGHIPYYPEEPNGTLISKIFDKDKLVDSRRAIILGDQYLQNQYMIINTDLVFILPTSHGSCLEFGDYMNKIPYRLIILVPARVIEDGTHTFNVIKSFQEEHPHSVIEFDGINEMNDRIKRCITREIKKRIRGEIWN